MPSSVHQKLRKKYFSDALNTRMTFCFKGLFSMISIFTTKFLRSHGYCMRNWLLVFLTGATYAHTHTHTHRFLMLTTACSITVTVIFGGGGGVIFLYILWVNQYFCPRNTHAHTHAHTHTGSLYSLLHVQ